MTMSRTPNGSSDLVSIGVYVVERDVDPLRSRPIAKLVAPKRSKLLPLAECVDRLARQPEQRCCSPRRNHATAELLEELRQFRVAGLSIRFGHCQTIVACTSRRVEY